MSPFVAVPAQVNVLALCGVRRALPGGGNKVQVFRKLVLVSFSNVWGGVYLPVNVMRRARSC